ncbi:MAG: AAA family ATPase [Candidatus Baltobacteraceae bacterium]
MEAAIPELEIRLLGQPAIRVAGVSVKIAKRATTLAMLAFLILRRDVPVARPYLAFTLFPDETEERALAELRRYLYLASKVLPVRGAGPWLVVDSETVGWNAEAPCSIDVVEFERAAADPASHDAAAGWYTGDLLEDLYDDWIVVERERLRTLHLDVLGRLTRRYRDAREHTRALGYAQRLLALDPWREDILREAMAIRYAAGDSAGALADCTRFAKRLAAEMDVAPMPETVALRDAIARNDPIPGSVPEPVPQTRARGAELVRLPFAGRARELEVLRSGWGRAARGRGGATLVGGEAGVGKSRLVAELARSVESEGGRVFVGGTSSPEARPYQCFVEALRSALPLIVAGSMDPFRAAILGRILPEVRPTSEALVEPPQLAPDREAARLFGVLADVVVALGRARPLLFVLEDVQWAGPATLDAFATVVRRLGKSSVFVLATYRDDDVDAARRLRKIVAALQTDGLLSTLALGRLARDDVAEIVARLRGFPEPDGATIDRLHAHTEGNPLFLNETIADILERRNGQAFLVDPVGSGIATIVSTRAARLSDAARTVAEIAAVVGEGCNVEIVRDVAGLDAATTAAAFDELLDRRLVREASARSGLDYVFTHHLIGASLYEGIEPALRARRHGRIAHLLAFAGDEAGDVRAAELARHFERAGLLAEAANRYGEAARSSARVYATGEALAFASRALELETDRERRVALLRLRETLHGLRGQRLEQSLDIDLLEETLSATAGDEARFDVLRRRLLLARSLGESERESRLVERMSEFARASEVEHVRAEALQQTAAHAVSLSRQAQGREPALAALELFERLGDVGAQIECLGLLVDIAANTGEAAELHRHLEAMRTRASSQADRTVQAKALTIAATVELLRQRYRESRDLTREALAIAVDIGDRDGEALARARIAANAAWLGEFDSALVEFDRAIALFESLGNKRGLAMTLTNKVLLAMRVGLFAEARELIERSNALLEIVQERRMTVANAVNASFVDLHCGEPEAALRQATVALELARTIGFPVFEAAALANLGNAERELGRLDEALEHMQEGLVIRRKHQDPGDFADDIADFALALVQAGKSEAALLCAEELAELMERGSIGALWPHYTAYAASQAFAAANEREQAYLFARRALEERDRFAASIGDERMRAAFLATRPSRLLSAQPSHDGGTPWH